MFCVNCGTKVLEEDKFCPKCGKPLKPSTQDYRTVDEATTVERKQLPLALRAVIVMGILFSGILLLNARDGYLVALGVGLTLGGIVGLVVVGIAIGVAFLSKNKKT